MVANLKFLRFRRSLPIVMVVTISGSLTACITNPYQTMRSELTDRVAGEDWSTAYSLSMRLSLSGDKTNEAFVSNLVKSNPKISEIGSVEYLRENVTKVSEKCAETDIRQLANVVNQYQRVRFSSLSKSDLNLASKVVEECFASDLFPWLNISYAPDSLVYTERSRWIAFSSQVAYAQESGIPGYINDFVKQYVLKQGRGSDAYRLLEQRG